MLRPFFIWKKSSIEDEPLKGYNIYSKRGIIMKKKRIISMSILFISIIILFLGVNFFRKDTIPIMQYPVFIEKLEESKVEKVRVINDEKLEVQLLDQGIYTVSNPMSVDFKEALLLKGVEVTYKSNADLSRVFSAIFVLSIALLVIGYSKKGNKEKSQLIKDYNKKDIHMENAIKFENVAGNYQAKELLEDIIDFIKKPEKYKELGARMPKGVLLYGVPGTGKTLLAKAIAGEANVPFYAMSGSDFVQMYVGVGAKRVRELFKVARKNKKAVIFIDEIDALGKSRSGTTSSANDEREQTLNALLTEMSGFNNTEGIIVIGATNRVDTLDAALLRPGRFDRQIEVALPDQKARKEILHLYLKEKPIGKDVNIDQLSKQSILFSGAMLEHLANEASILAANQESKEISHIHFEKAFYTVVAGMEKKNSNFLVQEEEKLITAYHEAGHALVTKLLLPELEIAKVTIIPTTKGVAGYNYNISKDKLYKRKIEIINSIKLLLGGRAAEEIIFGDENITTGAVNDLKQASKELYNYFSKYGMGDETNLFYIENNNNLDQKIYNQCAKKMKELYIETKNLLYENKEILDKIADLLMEEETIDGGDIERLII